MRWLFGDRTRVDKPPAVDRKVIAFPRKHVPPAEDTQRSTLFTELPFGSVDEVLWKARSDMRRGLTKPSACIVILYYELRENIIWYQYGREDDDADAMFRAWADEIMS